MVSIGIYFKPLPSNPIRNVILFILSGVSFITLYIHVIGLADGNDMGCNMMQMQTETICTTFCHQYSQRNYSTNSNTKMIQTTENVNNEDILIKIQELIDNNDRLYSITSDYKIIMDILNDNSKSLMDKQIEIENVYLKSFSNKQMTSIKNNTFLQNSDKGHLLLKDTITNLESDLDSFKSNPKYLKGKKYGIILSSLTSSIIISNVLSIVIPFIFRHENILDQVYQNLLIKIGKSLTNIFFREEYNKYYRSYMEWMRKNDRDDNFIYQHSWGNNIIEIRNKLSFKEFSDHVNSCIHDELQNNLEYSKLGHTILSFINLHSDLFTISEETNERGNSFTVIYPGKYIEELLNTFSLSDISKLPMICKPVNWKLDPNSNEIINYGGYINNKNDQINYIHVSYKNKGQIQVKNTNIVNTINFIQSTPFVINLKVL